MFHKSIDAIFCDAIQQFEWKRSQLKSEHWISFVCCCCCCCSIQTTWSVLNPSMHGILLQWWWNDYNNNNNKNRYIYFCTDGILFFSYVKPKIKPEKNERKIKFNYKKNLLQLVCVVLFLCWNQRRKKNGHAEGERKAWSRCWFLARNNEWTEKQNLYTHTRARATITRP